MSSAENSKQICVVACALVAAACATQIDPPLESQEILVPATGGVGGATSAPSTGGSLGTTGGTGTGGTGATASATGGTATGGTATGGTATGGTATGGTATGGTATGGTATGGTGGTSTATGGTGTSTAAGRPGRGGGNTDAGGTGMGTGSEMEGCAKLSVPMNGANDKAHFVISLRSAEDLSAPGTTISMHVYVEAGTGGVILAYAQDSSFNFLGAATRPLLADQQGWVTLDWDIGAEPAVMPAIMKRSVSRIGIEIKAAPSATWSNPTVVYVDSVSVNTPKLSFPFGSASTVSAMAQSSDVAGQALWLNSGSTDTTATGSTLSWVAMCP